MSSEDEDERLLHQDECLVVDNVYILWKMHEKMKHKKENMEII